MGFIICFFIVLFGTLIVFALGRMFSDWLIVGIIAVWAWLFYSITESQIIQQLPDSIGLLVSFAMILLPGMLCFPLIPNTVYFNKLTNIAVLLFRGKMQDKSFKQFTARVKEIWSEGKNEDEQKKEDLADTSDISDEGKDSIAPSDTDPDIEVPAQTKDKPGIEKVEFNCECGFKKEVAKKYLGKSGPCPKCGKTVKAMKVTV